MADLFHCTLDLGPTWDWKGSHMRRLNTGLANERLKMNRGQAP
jgi:hypothetical protein